MMHEYSTVLLPSILSVTSIADWVRVEYEAMEYERGRYNKASP